MHYGQKSIETIAEYNPDDVLPYTGPNHSTKKFVVNGVAYTVQMNSQRYVLFRKSRVCACCGIEGTKLVLQRFRSNPPNVGHFNLYGFNASGEPVLLTKDHIVPVSKGGKDHADNFRTLCTRCNGLRQNHDVSMEELKVIVENFVPGKSRKDRIKEQRILGRWKKRLRRARKLGLIPPPPVDPVTSVG